MSWILILLLQILDTRLMGQKVSRTMSNIVLHPNMSLLYHYSWPCGHTESLGRTAVDTNLQSTTELLDAAQASNTTSSLSLGEPTYPCPICSDTPEAGLNHIEALSARLDAYRHDDQIERERATAARAQRLRARQGPLTNGTDVGHSPPRHTRTYQEEFLAVTLRDKEFERQGLVDLQEHVIRRAEGRSSHRRPR